MREANNSIRISAETSIKAFDTSLNNLQFDSISILEKYAETTMQMFYDVGLFDRFVKKTEISRITSPLMKGKEEI